MLPLFHLSCETFKIPSKQRRPFTYTYFGKRGKKLQTAKSLASAAAAT